MVQRFRHRRGHLRPILHGTCEVCGAALCQYNGHRKRCALHGGWPAPTLTPKEHREALQDQFG